MNIEHLRDSVNRASVLLKLLSGRHRFTLLVTLLEGEMSVQQLALAVGKPDPGVSQQLAILRTAGLVSRRGEGQRRLYSISSPAAVQLMEAALAIQRGRAEAGTPVVAE